MGTRWRSEDNRKEVTTMSEDRAVRELHDSPVREMKASDEDAIRGLYEQMMDGWNRSSGEAFKGTRLVVRGTC